MSKESKKDDTASVISTSFIIMNDHNDQLFNNIFMPKYGHK